MSSLVMLARTYTDNDNVALSYVSEKLDGMRALWLPLSRGVPVAAVPWANRARDTREHTCTGLWTRYGKVIHAPDWWLDKLPTAPLDGELWMGRGRFQSVMSVTKTLVPGPEWSSVRYLVFDRPAYCRVFEPRVIRSPNYNLTIPVVLKDSIWTKFIQPEFNTPLRFETVRSWLMQQSWSTDVVEPLAQKQLAASLPVARWEMHQELERVVSGGGEGLILRRPHSAWKPTRSYEMVKLKPFLDAEGVVVGYTWGAGKYAGMVGSVRLRAEFQGVEIEFDLSGFNDLERTVRLGLTGQPGSVTNEPISDHFPIGSVVSFQYRELTDGGVPKEARFWRKL